MMFDHSQREDSPEVMPVSVAVAIFPTPINAIFLFIMIRNPFLDIIYCIYAHQFPSCSHYYRL